MTNERMAEHGRWLENLAFAGGTILLLFTGFREAVASCETHAFPWAAFIIASVLVAPKMLGRATAGRIWDALSKK